MKYFYITTPIYYVNDKPHIGHAYTTFVADSMARFRRFMGDKVKFLTGTDEHGQKVEKSATKAGIPTKEFVDKFSQSFRDLFIKMGTTHDDFIRTTEQRHFKAAQALWKAIEKNGDIYLGSYKGWYSIRDEAFFNENELIDGKAPTGADVEWVEEPSFFFRLSHWQEPLLKFYKENPNFISPTARRNEVIRFVEGGLKDLSISRTTFKWGIPVPDHPEHVMYVWLDALTNYITALGYPEQENIEFKNFWPQAVHLLGKDILRFHAVYWPAFMMSAGLQPPQKELVHGWWTHEGQKISKSLGNTIDPIELIDHFGNDAVRYFLLREVPFGQDGDFSRETLINRINADLSNAYGNLVQRVLSFIHKNNDGALPSPTNFLEDDVNLLKLATEHLHELETLPLHRYIETIWTFIHACNQYVDSHKPWVLKKENPERMNTVLYVLAETIRQIALLTQCCLPIGSKKILDYLAVPEDKRTVDCLNQKLLPGIMLPEPQPIYPRFI